jgi:hypothetical protein
MTDLTEDLKYIVFKSERLRADSVHLRTDITLLRAEIIRLTEISNKLIIWSNQQILENKKLSDNDDERGGCKGSLVILRE